MKTSLLLAVLSMVAFFGAGCTPPTPPISPDTIAPTVSITSPVENALVSGVIAVQVSATDNVSVSSVTVMVDGTLLGTSLAFPYVVNWNASNAGSGTHTLTASAVDPSGNIGYSAPATVVVSGPGPTVPVVTILSPSANSALSGTSQVMVSVNSSQSVNSFSLLIDGRIVQTLSGPPLTFTWNTTSYADGSHLISATARDASGNTGASNPVSVTVNNNSNSQATAIVKNDLVIPVEVSISGSDVGSVTPQSSSTFNVSAGQTVSFIVIKPTTTKGTTGIPVGDDMLGTFVTLTNSSNNQTFEVTNVIGNQMYFCPQFSNVTNHDMIMAMNYGLAPQNLTNAYVPAGASNDLFGYFKFYSNSNYAYWINGTQYGPTYWISKTQLPTPAYQTGVLALTIN